MTDDAPTLTLSSNELWQWAQAVNAVAALLARLRASRERDGRLAFSDDEHAARAHEARQHPPLRQMSDEERQRWQSRVPVALTEPHHDEPFTVWTAQLADADGQPTGEWGLEAHTWEQGVATSSLFIVCRDAADALAMTQHLRAHGAAEHLDRLHRLAARTPGEFVTAATAGVSDAASALTEHDWAMALRRALPPSVAEDVIADDPTHHHHSAWRELYALAAGEVERVGADPERLAREVARRPHWREDVRNAPSLAHWAITQYRASPSYLPTVVPASRPIGPAAGVEQDTAAEPREPSATGSEPVTAPRLTEVRDPTQAMAWATGLDARNPEHRIEAELGFGRWGSRVDAVLCGRFGGLTEKINAAAKREREGRAEQPTVAVIAGEPAAEEPALDGATLRKLAAEVDRLNPAKPIDRRAAHTMLGHVPVDIDRLILERFGDDPKIVEKIQSLYPDGLPEADAAAWRNRATGDDLDEAAALATPDDPRTPHREDVAGDVAATREHGHAAAQRGVAAVVAGQQSPVVRRTTQTVPAAAPQRRS